MTAMARTYARRGADTPEARELRKRMAANRRRRERLERDLEEVRLEAGELCRDARGTLTYEAMADALGLSRAMVGYHLQAEAPERAAG